MLDQMTTFVRIAETGSITRAARSVGVSLPMASRHLRWLEQELGTALVHRTTRQLHLTDAGQDFATRARALLRGLDDAKQALRPGPSLAGRVVVTAPNALGTYQLSSILPSLAARHPRLRIDLRLEDRPIDLVKDGGDLAILPPAPPDHAPRVPQALATSNRVGCPPPNFLSPHGPIHAL